MTQNDINDRFLEIEDAILKERERALARIRRTQFGSRLRAQVERAIDSGTGAASWHRALIAFRGIVLVTAAASLIWVSTRHSKTETVSAYKALTTTLSLVIEPSQSETSAKLKQARIQEEKFESLIGRVLSHIIQGRNERTSYLSIENSFEGIPLFTPEEINRILLRDKVIERALFLVKKENKEV
jgi:hypothetical protein